MPKRVPLREATDAGAVGGPADGSANGAVATMPPPPATSSEARGERPWADTPHDTPFKPEVAERISRIAKGEETVEWPPKDASPAWLSGREEAIAGGPVEFNPHEEGTPEHAEWVKGWEATQAEVKTLAEDLEPHVQAALDEDARANGKTHPEGHFDLFTGIPADETFEGKDVQNIESQQLAILGRKLIDDNGEFKHLRNLNIRWYWRRNGGAPSAKVRFGAAHHPDGMLRDELQCDWVVWLAADHFRNARPTKRQVDACLYHQLCHAQVTSKGKLTVQPHAFEGFPAELQRYGAWNSDLVSMLEAAGKKPSPDVVQTALNLDGASSADEDEETEDDDDSD